MYFLVNLHALVVPHSNGFGFCVRSGSPSTISTDARRSLRYSGARACGPRPPACAQSMPSQRQPDTLRSGACRETAVTIDSPPARRKKAKQSLDITKIDAAASKA